MELCTVGSAQTRAVATMPQLRTDTVLTGDLLMHWPVRLPLSCNLATNGMCMNVAKCGNASLA
jgi:hypothetical protein